MTDPAAVVREFIEGYQTGHDPAVAERLLADDFVDHTPFGPFPADRDGVLALFGMIFAAFPDVAVEIHQQLVDGEFVTTRKTFRGTHRGEFMGVPASGSAIEFGVIDILRVADGQLREHWNQLDALTLLQQVGMIPALG